MECITQDTLIHASKRWREMLAGVSCSIDVVTACEHDRCDDGRLEQTELHGLGGHLEHDHSLSPRNPGKYSGGGRLDLVKLIPPLSIGDHAYWMAPICMMRLLQESSSEVSDHALAERQHVKSDRTFGRTIGRASRERAA